jgi:carbamoylphosphate synthase large subunit
MNVIFIEPSFPYNQREFVRALHAAGANVIGIGERPESSLSDELRHWLGDYIQIRSVVDESALLKAVRFVQDRLWVDRLEATIEAHIMAAAAVREKTGIPGTSTRTAWLCRDKPAMKEVLREGGVATAASMGSDSPDEILAFAGNVGYPLIVKPRSGAGASGATRVDSDDALRAALAAAGIGHGGSVAVEEFVEGHEGFYDTVSAGGHVLHDFVSHYFPNVLEAMRTRWISPQIVVTNRIDSAPDYAEVRALGARVHELLGIDTTATHMEWFFGPKGLRFSEIGCRPPGVRTWDLYSAANEIDLYMEWALAVLHGRRGKPSSRRYAAGLIALRPDRDGVISHCEGLDEVHRRFGEWILDAHIPSDGTPTQPVEGGYMANAWIRMRHPDFDVLRGMLDTVGEITQLRAR